MDEELRDALLKDLEGINSMQIYNYIRDFTEDRLHQSKRLLETGGNHWIPLKEIMDEYNQNYGFGSRMWALLMSNFRNTQWLLNRKGTSLGIEIKRNGIKGALR